MNRWTRPTALSAGLAVLAVLLLIGDWNPWRAVAYAAAWTAATIVLFGIELRNTNR